MKAGGSHCLGDMTLGAESHLKPALPLDFPIIGDKKTPFDYLRQSELGFFLTCKQNYSTLYSNVNEDSRNWH